jgi:hypothetical protein
MNAQKKHDKHEAHRRLVTRLQQQAEEIRRLVSGLDDALLSRRTIADKWSLKELVCHIWRVQQVFEGRLDAMLAQENPSIESYNPERDPQFEKLLEQQGTECLSGFLSARTRFTQRLESLSPAEWHRQGRHPDFPHFDVHFQVEYMAHHEAHHIYQMFQRRVPLGKMPH